MMSLVIPAAGNGSRLGMPTTPKALAPFGSENLLSVILSRVGNLFDEIVIVTKPGMGELFHNTLAPHLADSLIRKIKYRTQVSPIGSLDAVIIGLEAAAGDAVVLWCDQIGVSSETLKQMITEIQANQFVMPYLSMRHPYVWLEINENQVLSVGRSRDGDTVPEIGYADLGTFAFRQEAKDLLKEITPELTSQLGERELDFTYAIPKLSQELQAKIFETHDERQSIAVNTANDLKMAEGVILGEQN